MKKMFGWIPRILAILFIAFISIFALDVLGEPRWLLALFMHLIPSFVLAGLTVIAWKNSGVGGWLFLIVGVMMAIFYHSMVIAVPACVIGIFFLADGFGDGRKNG